MEYRKIPGTEIEVSAVGMGCWPIVGDANWNRQEEKDSIATIEAALDADVNFFDTAEAYGNGYSESLLGKVLGKRRHESVIATKVSSEHLSADDVYKACEGSLQRLNTDYIDLYQIHWPNRTIPITETMGALENLRKQGKVRAIGLSNFGLEDLSDFLTNAHCATNQVAYSLLFRAIEYEILQKCLDNNIGIIPYCPLCQGLLTGKFSSADEVPEGRARTRHFSTLRPQIHHGQPGCEEETFAAIGEIRLICDRINQPMAHVAMAWLLKQPGVISVPAGARNPNQIKQNAQAAALKLPSDIVDELTEATNKLKAALGPNADMWASESRIR